MFLKNNYWQQVEWFYTEIKKRRSLWRCNLLHPPNQSFAGVNARAKEAQAAAEAERVAAQAQQIPTEENEQA